MSLSTYLIERLKITSKTKSLQVQPTSKDELIEIIQDELKRQGPDADLNFIDTSLITDMKNLFTNYATIRNIKIDQWDVSNVTNMWGVFNGCSKFNCDLSKWNVSNATNMAFMFSNCTNFNSNLSSWDVGNVTDMDQMFFNCENFDSDLRTWDVSNVKTYKKFAGLCLQSFVKKIPNFK